MARWWFFRLVSSSRSPWRRMATGIGMLAAASVLLTAAGGAPFTSHQARLSDVETSEVQSSGSLPGPLELSAGTLNVQVSRGQRAVRKVALKNTGTEYASWAIAEQGTTQTTAVRAAEVATRRPATASRTDGQPLRQMVADEGRVRVIVEVDAQYTSEKSLSRSAVRAQRWRIDAVQQRVLGAVEPHSSSVWASDHMPLVALEVDEEGLERLLGRSDVVRVVQDRADPLHLETSTHVVGATDAWNRGHRGDGQAVAVLDAGISNEHPFLDDEIVYEACFSTESSAQDTESLCPDGTEVQMGEGVACNSALGSCAHGTHVAGIAAGRGEGRSGVAPAADVIAMQVFSRFNDEETCDGEPPCYRAFWSDQVRALEHAYELRNDHNIAAVNMSLGGGGDAGYCSDDPRAAIVGELRLNGIATVTSSGNDGFSSAVGAPACLRSTIAVGSTQDGNDGTTVDRVSSFSNSAWMLDFLAPGEGIESSTRDSGFRTFSGTSMSAPHVAGAWALMSARWPGASVAEIQSRLDAAGAFVTDPRNGIARPRLAVGSALAEDRWLVAGPTYGTVQPEGTEELTFVVDAASLPLGSYQRTISIAAADGGSEEVLVNVEVVESSPARAQVEPQAVTGATRTGRVLEIVQTVSNTATSTADVLRVRPVLPSFLTRDRVLGEGVVVTDTTVRIRPQKTATLIYHFQETADSYTVYRDSIRLETNDPALGTVAVPTEVAVRVPRIAVEPSLVDFGVVPAGVSSGSVVTVANVGSAPFTARSLVGTGGDQFSITQNAGTVTVPPGESREVRLSSEAEVTDIRKGMLEITHDAVNAESPIQIDLQSAPDELILHPPFPNPLRSSATIEYSIPEAAEVRVEVYDVLGRRVALLRRRREQEGVHEVQWRGRSTNGARVAAGPYFVRVRAGEAVRTERLTIVR